MRFWNPLFSPTETNDIECTILNEDSPKIEKQQKKLYFTKEHQKSLVYRCRELEESTNKKLK